MNTEINIWKPRITQVRRGLPGVLLRVRWLGDDYAMTGGYEDELAVAVSFCVRQAADLGYPPGIVEAIAADGEPPEEPVDLPGLHAEAVALADAFEGFGVSDQANRFRRRAEKFMAAIEARARAA